MPSCVMRYCTNYTSKAFKSQGITYHSFPSNDQRHIQWVDIVRKQRKEEYWEPSRSSKVCSIHFKTEDKYTSGKGLTLLKKSACPVLQNKDKAPSRTAPTPGPSRPQIFAGNDEPEHPNDDDDGTPDNLSKYRDDNEALGPAKRNNDNHLHEGIRCDNCNGCIIGFRYTCVQCSNYDHCVACEASGAHDQHYVLRVPVPSPYNEIESVLAGLRMYLVRELEPISTAESDKDVTISVKCEVKSENEEEEDEEFEDKDEILDEDIVNYNIKQEFTLPSPESLYSEKADSVSYTNETIREQVEILNTTLKQENRSPLHVRSLDNSEPTSPSTGKRKIIFKMPDYAKVNESSQLARKICVLPSTSTQDVPNATIILVPKVDGVNPTVKLLKEPLDSSLEDPVFKIAKTNAENCKNYRRRKKMTNAAEVSQQVPIKRTAAERARACRLRKKKNSQGHHPSSINGTSSVLLEPDLCVATPGHTVPRVSTSKKLDNSESTTLSSNIVDPIGDNVRISSLSTVSYDNRSFITLQTP